MMMRKSNIPHSPLLKRKRKEVAIMKAFGGLFVLVVLFGTIVWGVNHKTLLITNITVSGAEVTNPELVNSTVQDVLAGDYFYFFPKANSLIYPKEEIVARVLKDFSRFSDVSIHFVNFNTIRINVTERIPYGLWCEEPAEDAGEQRECYFFDDVGYIFDEAPRFFGAVYFSVFGPLHAYEHAAATFPIRGVLLAEGVFEKVATLRDRLANENIETTHLTLRENGNIDLYMEFGGRLILSSTQDFNKVFSNFLVALEAKMREESFDMATLAYVDLRFDDRIYFKFNKE